MGSPAFGLPSLRSILRAGHEIALVISQPDRPVGRSGKPVPPPVAAFARAEGLTFYQPERLRTPQELGPLEESGPDAIVVAAFGMLLPRTVLDLPRHGCLNVHPSLLPRWRGASPVEAALLAGDTQTGATIMKLTEELDAGPILAQASTPIGPREDALELEARLAEIGSDLLVETLEPWAAGRLEARPQDEARATYCRRLGRADAELDWSEPAARLDRVVRAFRSRGGAFTYWNDHLLKVLVAEVVAQEPGHPEPGVVFERNAGSQPRLPLVATADGALALLEIALGGRAATSGPAFLNGYPGLVGARLGRGVGATQDVH
jgi:methionyl-tRNA formyltransferase